MYLSFQVERSKSQTPKFSTDSKCPTKSMSDGWVGPLDCAGEWHNSGRRHRTVRSPNCTRVREELGDQPAYSIQTGKVTSACRKRWIQNGRFGTRVTRRSHCWWVLLRENRTLMQKFTMKEGRQGHDSTISNVMGRAWDVMFRSCEALNWSRLRGGWSAKIS